LPRSAKQIESAKRNLEKGKGFKAPKKHGRTGKKAVKRPAKPKEKKRRLNNRSR